MRGIGSGGKRIVFVTKTVVHGGTEKHLVDLLARLDLLEIEPVVLCVGRDVYSEPLRDRGKVGVRVDTIAQPGSLWGYWVAFAKLRPAVIVFVNGQLGLFPWQAYVAGKLGWGRRVVSIEHLIADRPPEGVQGHGLVGRVRSVMGWRARHLARLGVAGTLSDTTICVSDAVRERLVREYGYPSERTITIMNGVDVEYYRPDTGQALSVRKDLGIAPDDRVVLCVASLVAQKRVDLLLEALARLAADGIRCKCIVAGDGPLRAALVEWAAQLDVSTLVFFVGFAKDIRPYLQASDLFVLPSDKEGLPLALLEAMAYGVPCIATNVGGNSEVISHGENGLIVEPGSGEGLAEAIRFGLMHSDAMRMMARNGRNRVRQEFRVEETMRRVTALLCA